VGGRRRREVASSEKITSYEKEEQRGALTSQNGIKTEDCVACVLTNGGGSEHRNAGPLGDDSGFLVGVFSEMQNRFVSKVNTRPHPRGRCQRLFGACEDGQVKDEEGSWVVKGPSLRNRGGN